jgi:hypothetical protein
MGTLPREGDVGVLMGTCTSRRDVSRSLSQPTTSAFGPIRTPPHFRSVRPRSMLIHAGPSHAPTPSCPSCPTRQQHDHGEETRKQDADAAGKTKPAVELRRILI